LRQRNAKKKAEKARRAAKKRARKKRTMEENNMMELLHTMDREYTRNVVPIIELDEPEPEKPAKKKPKKKPAAKKKAFDKGAFLEEAALEKEAEDCKPPFCLPKGLETSRKNEEQKEAEEEAKLQARFVQNRRKVSETRTQTRATELLEESHETRSGRTIIKDWAAEKEEKHKATRERAQKKKQAEVDKRAAAAAEEERKQQKRRDERRQKFKVKEDMAYTQAKAEAMDELNDEFLQGHVSKERLDRTIHMHMAADAIKSSLQMAANSAKHLQEKSDLKHKPHKHKKSKRAGMHDLLMQAGDANRQKTHHNRHSRKKHRKKEHKHEDTDQDQEMTDAEREELKAMGIEVDP